MILPLFHLVLKLICLLHSYRKVDALFLKLTYFPLKQFSSPASFLCSWGMLLFPTKAVWGQKQVLHTRPLEQPLRVTAKCSGVSPITRWKGKTILSALSYLSDATSFPLQIWGRGEDSATTNFPLCSTNWSFVTGAFLLASTWTKFISEPLKPSGKDKEAYLKLFPV